MLRVDYVGILDTIRRRDNGIVAAARQADVQAAHMDPSTYPLGSPWSSSNLQRILFEDIFGSDIPCNTRSAAMKLGPLARARNLIVSTICRQPLVALAGTEALAEQPTWLYRTDDGTSPQLKMAWTIDDLIFYGWSCWGRVNGADGFPLTTHRIPQDEWDFDDDTHSVLVRGVPAGRGEVILIAGLHEGILSFGSDVIDDARTLFRNVRRRIANPVPGLELHQTGGDELTDDEIDALVAEWAAARAGENGGVAYTNEFIETKELGSNSDTALMIEARNAAAVDLARIVGISAGQIDATAPKASLNYETTTGRNQEFVDLDLALYMTPITARLSMDDVCPRGQRVDFDLSALTGPTFPAFGPNLED